LLDRRQSLLDAVRDSRANRREERTRSHHGIVVRRNREKR
jgi:hypothetical protein